jgi:glutaminyl-tRNA synthetase
MGADDKLDACSAPVHPHPEARGKREFKFGRELWIERTDYERRRPRASSACSRATRCA